MDSREKIVWMQLETLDANEFPSNFENEDSLTSGVSPILLILGYGFGVQVSGFHMCTYIFVIQFYKFIRYLV